jgi:hypothetical protein
MRHCIVMLHTRSDLDVHSCGLVYRITILKVDSCRIVPLMDRALSASDNSRNVAVSHLCRFAAMMPLPVCLSLFIRSRERLMRDVEEDRFTLGE